MDINSTRLKVTKKTCWMDFYANYAWKLVLLFLTQKEIGVHFANHLDV